MRRLLLFDIDGTLAHCDGAGRAALEEAMWEVYGETGLIDGLDFHGKTDPAIVRELLRELGHPDAWIEDRFERLWNLYSRGLERELAARRPRLRAFPGVRELLARLREDRHFVLALVTGNVESGAWLKLGACRLDEPFGFGAFGSDSEHRDELPPLAMRRAEARTGRRFKLHEVVVIGDTPADVGCARAAGVRALAVGTGAFSAEQLAGLAPDHLFADLADVDGVVAALEA